MVNIYMHLSNLVNSVFSVLISMYKHSSEGQIIYTKKWHVGYIVYMYVFNVEYLYFYNYGITIDHLIKQVLFLCLQKQRSN